MVWSAYHCVMAFLVVYFVSQCILIEPSLHQLDFFLEIFLWRLVTALLSLLYIHCSSIVYIVITAHAPVVIIIPVTAWADTCSTKMASSMVAHCLVIIGRCSTQTTVLLQTKYYPWEIIILMIDSCFICVTSCVTALGWLKKERRKKKTNNSEFRPFQVGHLRIISENSKCYCILEQLI